MFQEKTLSSGDLAIFFRNLSPSMRAKLRKSSRFATFAVFPARTLNGADFDAEIPGAQSGHNAGRQCAETDAASRGR
jgi:hypothetical protein